jgi:adenylate cyclase
MTDQEKTHTGGCMCGSVRYEVAGEPMEVGYCHCQMCQKSLGSVFGVFAIFDRQGFRFTEGEPRFYRSSHAKQRSFCPNCGSPLTMWNADKAIQTHVGILIGTLDHPEHFPPERYSGNHSGIESQVPWFKMDDGLPRRKTEDDQWYVSPNRGS